MKILVVNGSPRKGNTVAAIQAFSSGVAPEHEIEVIDAQKLSIAGCKGCGACGMTRGCVDKDDTNTVVEKIVAADVVVFATPVYWWGITAQLKLVLDKCYCRGYHLKGKKIGVIVCGGSPVDNMQYELIRGQFKCISEYLNWDIMFHKSYYASDIGDLAADSVAIEELKAEGAKF